jgi:NADPH:quinone reductase-like Zn-dependent oxidoreductase
MRWIELQVAPDGEVDVLIDNVQRKPGKGVWIATEVGEVPGTFYEYAARDGQVMLMTPSNVSLVHLLIEGKDDTAMNHPAWKRVNEQLL